jgi:hypothetical protein
MDSFKKSSSFNFLRPNLSTAKVTTLTVNDNPKPEKQDCFLLKGQDAYGKNFYKMMAGLALLFAAIIPLNNWIHKEYNKTIEMMVELGWFTK